MMQPALCLALWPFLSQCRTHLALFDTAQHAKSILPCEFTSCKFIEETTACSAHALTFSHPCTHVQRDSPATGISWGPPSYWFALSPFRVSRILHLVYAGSLPLTRTLQLVHAGFLPLDSTLSLPMRLALYLRLCRLPSLRTASWG